MLSSALNRLTYLLAVLYGVLGAILFFAPTHTAGTFAWKVSPFVTMTIGAWCLGNAWAAWTSARRWPSPLIRTVLLYLFVFGILESAVLVLFRARLQLGHPIAWLYVLTLAANAVTAVWGIAELSRAPAWPASTGERPSRALRALLVGFIAFVAFIAVGCLSRGLNGQGANGAVFPEPMSAFTLTSFGAFYSSLALAVIPLLWARDRAAFVFHGYASYALLVIITIATFVYIGRFDFAARPYGLIYIGAYVVVGVVVAYYLFKYGSGVPRQQRLSAAPA